MSGGPRPRLAVAYDSRSLPPMEFAQVARPYCDLIWVLDLTDPVLGPLEQLFRRLGPVVNVAGVDDETATDLVAVHRPDGIIALAEHQMMLAAVIAERLDLRFYDRRTADNLASKLTQRLALAAAGVPGPGFWSLAGGIGADEAALIAHAVSYPAVVKPQDGTGSRDTHTVADAGHLLRLLGEIGIEAGGLIVEEQFVELHPRSEQVFADVLMVESVVCRGAFSHLTATGHFVPAAPFRGTGSFVPSHLDVATVQAVYAATEAAVTAMGIRDGCTNTDVILTPDGPRVVEVNGRIGGQIPQLFDLVGGPPVLDIAVRLALGERLGPVEPLRTDRVAYCYTYQPPMQACRLVALEGIDAVSRLPGVTSVALRRRPGDLLDWRFGTMGNLFTVYGTADDHRHLAELRTSIDETVTVLYDFVAGDDPDPDAGDAREARVAVLAR